MPKTIRKRRQNGHRGGQKDRSRAVVVQEVQRDPVQDALMRIGETLRQILEWVGGRIEDVIAYLRGQR